MLNLTDIGIISPEMLLQSQHLLGSLTSVQSVFKYVMKLEMAGSGFEPVTLTKCLFLLLLFF